MYDWLRKRFPAKVYAESSSREDHVADKAANDNSPLLQHSEHNSETALTPSSYDPLAELRLWGRRMWAHSRGLDLVLVDENGDDIASSYVKNVSQMTVQDIKNARKKYEGKIYLVERPNEYAYIQVENFEFYSDGLQVGGINGGLTFTVALTSYASALTPFTELLFIFSMMMAQSGYRAFTNWNEILNANNINNNKQLKTGANTAFFLLGLIGTIISAALLVGAGIPYATTVLPLTLLVMPAYRFFQHTCGFIFNIAQVCRHWKDARQAERFRKLAGQKGLQALEALFNFATMSIIVALYYNYFPITQPIAIGVTTFTLSVKLFTFAREFPEFYPVRVINSWMKRLFPAAEEQKRGLENETLLQKTKRFAGKSTDDDTVEITTQSGETKRIKIATRTTLAHEGAIPIELSTIRTVQKVKEKDELLTSEEQELLKRQHAVAILSLTESTYGIQHKINDYKARLSLDNTQRSFYQRFSDFFKGKDTNDNLIHIKITFLEQLSKMLLENLPTNDSTNQANIKSSEDRHEKRAVLKDAIKEQTRNQIKLIQAQSHQKTDQIAQIKEQINQQAINIKKLESEFYNLEIMAFTVPAESKKSHSTHTQAKQALIEKCQNLQDFESLFRANPNLKREIFQSLKKISYCESYCRGAVEKTKVFPGSLNEQLQNLNISSSGNNVNAPDNSSQTAKLIKLLCNDPEKITLSNFGQAEKRECYSPLQSSAVSERSAEQSDSASPETETLFQNQSHQKAIMKVIATELLIGGEQIRTVQSFINAENIPPMPASNNSSPDTTYTTLNNSNITDSTAECGRGNDQIDVSSNSSSNSLLSKTDSSRSSSPKPQRTNSFNSLNKNSFHHHVDSNTNNFETASLTRRNSFSDVTTQVREFKLN